jgi:molybdopterin synthase sulfur carrier subunit
VDEGASRGETGETSAAPARVQVRYWAAARAAAGTTADVVEARTVAEALAATRDLHRDDPAFDKVLSVCSVLVGEQPLGGRDPAEVAVGDGDVLDVLPPFAGG